MSEIKSVSTVELNIILKLTEVEARALDALVAYGAKPFLEVFYTKMGKSYLEPHEDGLISLFKTVQKEMPAHFAKADTARKALKV